MSAASNTRECFIDCIGLKVSGVLFDALPLSRRDLRAGKRTLLFEDGTGLSISANGSFWRESKNDIFGAIREKEAELASASNEHRAVLELAGLEALR